MPRLAAFTLTAVVCLTLYWPGLWTWFHLDDFSWLRLPLMIHDFSDFMSVVFLPKDPTTRPLSEPLFFLTFERLFGLDAFPFRTWVFATQLLNLWLLLRLVERVTGSLRAGMWAALLWVVNSALATPMAWTSTYNQVLCACMMLAGLNQRWVWLQSGSRRARAWEWTFFLLGFAVLELQVVYPVLAGALTLLYRRERWRDLIPLFLVAVGYGVLNRSLALQMPQMPQIESYRMHWNAKMIGTLVTYLRLATGIWTPGDFTMMVAECIAGGGLIAAIISLASQRDRWVVLGLVFFLAPLAPVLPLPDHVSDYYLTVPAIGLAMIGGLSIVQKPLWALMPVLAYMLASGSAARSAVLYHYELGERAEALVKGVLQASEAAPGKSIILVGVASDQYWTVINYNAFRLFPGLQVYLAPGSADAIDKHPDVGNPGVHVMNGLAAVTAVEDGRARVYSVAGTQLRDETESWRTMAGRLWKDELAPVVDAGDPAYSSQLGDGWLQLEGEFRWMSGRATMRLAVPAGSREFFLSAQRPEVAGAPESFTVRVRLNGSVAGQWQFSSRESPWVEISTALPDDVNRSRTVEVDISVAPTIEQGGRGRSLGLAFGKIGVR